MEKILRIVSQTPSFPVKMNGQEVSQGPGYTAKSIQIAEGILRLI